MTEYLLDTGPLVAFLRADDQWHSWASSTLPGLGGNFRTCDPVITEAAHLLRRDRRGIEGLLAMLETGELFVERVFPEELPAIRALLEGYRPRASLADACLVRLSELHATSRVITLDDDFLVYRRHRRQRIPLIAPFADR